MSAAALLDDLSSEEENEILANGEDAVMEESQAMESEEVVRRAKAHLDDISSTLAKIEQVRYMDIDSIDKATEVEFLGRANVQLDQIANDIVEIHNFIKVHYTPVFPELSSLVPNAVEYSRIVQIIGNNLELATDENEQLKAFLSGDKVLVISMSSSLLRQSHHNVSLSEREISVIMTACDMLLRLDAARCSITDYIASRAPLVAPNLTVLLGPVVAAQLISTLSLEGIATAPACNLASIGSNRVVGTGMSNSGIRQRGYIYSSEIVQSVPEDYRKKAMRMLSAKVVLAARVDMSHKSNDVNPAAGVLGQKWRAEVTEKLEKAQAPPENAATKALPLPVTAPSKKRGGRRFRKLKQQFEMSELAKAQNKMAFGEQEDTVMNAYGEEVGLGLAGKNASSGNYRAITSGGSKAKITKAMEKRLQAAMAAGEGNTKLVKSLMSDK